MVDRFRLQVLSALAASGSFSAAARELGISQPAVSQNIAELEKYAGGKLFLRSRGGVSLTRKGSELLRRAQAVLDAYAEMDAACKAPSTILLRDVTLGQRRCNVLIDRGLIADLELRGEAGADKIIDAAGLVMLPSYFDAFCPGTEGLQLCLRDGCGFVSFAPSELEADIVRIEDFGIRAALAVPAEQKELLRTWESPDPEMLSLIVDIPDGCSPDCLQKIFTLSRKRRCRLRLRAAAGTVKLLDSLHLLGSDVLLYGCSALEGEEWKRAGRRGVSIIHCPTTDYRGSGRRFPYELALASGCRMLLGTGDSHHSIAEEIRTAVLLSSVGGKALEPETVRRWATANAAEAFGVDAASFARGRCADLILAESGAEIPDSSNIRCLICAGRVLQQSGR